MSPAPAPVRAAPRADGRDVYTFGVLDAIEDPDARDEVLDFARVDLHEADMRAYVRAVDAARAAGAAPPPRSRAAFDLAWCRAESRRIRTKRERDATYYADLTDKYVDGVHAPASAG